jgi:hypothetical protein
MPGPENTDAFRTTPAASNSVPVTAPPTEMPVAAPAPGEFSGLRAYPSNPFQTSELPPPKPATSEVVAGAILGGFLGLALFGYPGLVFGPVVGAVDGWWVGKLAGRLGRLRVWSLALNLLRIPFINLVTVLFPFSSMRWLAERDLEDR